MKRGRRMTGIEMNFDGLTDSVTNLVGMLVLLLVLLINVTREAVYTPPTAPVKAGAAQPLQDHETDQLLAQVDVLRERIRRITKTVVDLETEVPQLAQEVQELVSNAGSSSVPGEAR